MKKLYVPVLLAAMILLPGCELLAKWGLGPNSGNPDNDSAMEEPAMMEDQDSMQMMDSDFDPGDDPDKMEGEWSAEEMEKMEMEDEAMMEDDKMMEDDSMEKDESAMMDSNTDSKYAAGVLNDYSAEAFAQAKADGKKILLDFHADWCPTCRTNDPLIQAALTGSDVIGFKVNYDTETSLKSTFGVTTQSTLVLLNGDVELTRGVGDQTEASLATFLAN